MASYKKLETGPKTSEDLSPHFYVQGTENKENALFRKMVSIVSGKPEAVAS